jgi:hypothetical protein
MNPLPYNYIIWSRVTRKNRRYILTPQGEKAPDTLEVIRRTVLYMENDIFGPNANHDLRDEILAECTNREDLCSFWAVIGGKGRVRVLTYIHNYPADGRAVRAPDVKCDQISFPPRPPPPLLRSRMREESLVHENEMRAQLSDVRNDRHGPSLSSPGGHC